MRYLPIIVLSQINRISFSTYFQTSRNKPFKQNILIRPLLLFFLSDISKIKTNRPTNKGVIYVIHHVTMRSLVYTAKSSVENESFFSIVLLYSVLLFFFFKSIEYLPLNTQKMKFQHPFYSRSAAAFQFIFTQNTLGINYFQSHSVRE